MEAPRERPPIGLTTPGVIHRVIDGDTLVFLARGTIPIRVRLLDCWAPESRTRDPIEREKGMAAKASLRRYEGRSGVLYIPTGQAMELADLITMGRVLGAVWVDDDPRSLSQIQRDEGHAWATKAEQQDALARDRAE